jgi:hypothetical protein
MDLTCSPRQLGTRSLLKTAPQRQDPVNGILAVVGAKRTATVPVWGLHKFGTESNHPPRASPTDETVKALKWRARRHGRQASARDSARARCPRRLPRG